MGLPRRGTRSIVVGGIRYRWHPSYERRSSVRGCCPLSVAVERAGGGQRLYAHFAGRELKREYHLAKGREEAVLPRVVERIIRAGIAAGWEPESRGLSPLEIDGEPYPAETADA